MTSDMFKKCVSLDIRSRLDVELRLQGFYAFPKSESSSEYQNS